MDLQNLAVAIAVLVLAELALDVRKKAPLWLSRQSVASFQRMWQESKLLYCILHTERFAQWRPKTARYAALRAIKAQDANQATSQPVLNLLRKSSLEDGEPVVLLGEPGTGKTTMLEALTYSLAQRAYRRQVLLWFGLLFVAALPLLFKPVLWFAPILSLVWLVSFFLWESFARRAIVPLFLEVRSGYRKDEEVEDWHKGILRKNLGETPLFDSRNRVVFLLDGVNEVQADLYGSFMEGWRARLKKQRPPRVIFTSRPGEEDPTPGLGLDRALTITDLDDSGVREFLQVYGREKAELAGKPYSRQQVDVDLVELQSNNLLGPKGIGRNPYWLKMIVEGGVYTRNRGVLFRTFARNLIRRETKEKPDKRKRELDWKIVPLEKEMDALASLALAMHQEQRVGFTDEAGWHRGRTVIRERLTDESLADTKCSPDDVLAEAKAATLVRTRFKSRIEFVHQLVQEFFAAYALRHEGKWPGALAHVENVWWWQTLFLLGGLVIDDSPQAYSKLVQDVLGDGSNEQRLFAAMGLLQSVDDPPSDLSNRVLETFIASIGETLSETQQQAAQELGRILGDGAAEAFGDLLHDPNPSIRRKGAALLCAVRVKRAIGILLTALREENQTRAMVEILVSIGAPAVEPLITAFRDPDHVSVRRDAASALGIIGDSRAVEPLIKVLGDPGNGIRQRAASALGKIGHPDAVKPLIDALDDTDDEMRQRAASALGKIGDRRAVEPLITALNDHDYFVRLHATNALGKIRDRQAVERLITALDDRFFSSVRRSAASALGEIGDPHAVEPLIARLDDSDYSVRRDAASALGEIGDPRAVEPLIASLHDTGEGVPLHSVYALGEIGDSRAVGRLIEILDDPTEGMRQGAASALGKIGDRNALDKLKDLAQADPDNLAARNAIEKILQRME